MPVISINLNRLKYSIIVGPKALHRLEPKLNRLVRGGQIFVFYDAQVYALHHGRIRAQLKGVRGTHEEMVVPVGERSKSGAVLNKVYAFLFDQRISRSDFILACGGGVTSDLVGFAAATTLRGIRWGIVSTTLLGMVDAAIGGKTGINHPLGKNLIGAFWQPSIVVCDTSFLKTLPARQVLAGLGEIMKYGGLVGPKMLTVIEKYLGQYDLYDEKLLFQLIRLSAAYKADIVVKDEYEKGIRMFLNLGHTFAHAVENAAGYGKLLHGEAVVLGLLAAVELSCQLKSRRIGYLTGYRRILEQMIHFIPRRKISCRKALKAMQLDKKRTGITHRFVLLEKPGRPFVTDNVDPLMVVSSLESMLKVYQSEGGRHAPNPGC